MAGFMKLECMPQRVQVPTLLVQSCAGFACRYILLDQAAVSPTSISLCNGRDEMSRACRSPRP